MINLFTTNNDNSNAIKKRYSNMSNVPCESREIYDFFIFLNGRKFINKNNLEINITFHLFYFFSLI